MNHTAFFEALKAGRIAGCYLFEGTEEYIKQQALKNLCARLLPEGLEQMNLTDLTDPAPDALIAAAETLPFLAEKRVVVVRECTLLTAGRKSEDEDRAAALMDYVPCIPAYGVRGVLCQGQRPTAARSLHAAQNRMPSWILPHERRRMRRLVLRRMGKRLSGENAARLVFTVGRDAALLRQEMDKLCAYLGEREEIAAEDIDQICTRSTECTVFQMVDAQVAGNNDTAFALLLATCSAPARPGGHSGHAAEQYRILYHMRCLMDERTRAGVSGRSCWDFPFAVGRTQQQAPLDRARLLRGPAIFCWTANTRIKQGRVAQRAAPKARF